ncbi:MAG: CPBP family intramembrane metalloprotease [Planctomycetes bacterium]|nr:CPBP family intramembrane metalloprotease [Planctomycetota bacterium]
MTAPLDIAPGMAAVLAGLCVGIAGIAVAGILAPRFLWPGTVRRIPETPADLPDWRWPWLVVVPPTVVLFKLVAFPLLWMGVSPSLWLAFAVSSASGLVSGILAWWVLCRRLGKPASALGLKLPSWKPHLALLPILGYPLGFSMIILAGLFQIFVLKQPVPSPQLVMKALKGITDPKLRMFAVFAIAVVAPIAEEILFRGVLFRALRHRWGFVAGMVVSAACFSAMHRDLDHFLAIFLLGMVLAFLAEESKSIFPGMCLHAMVNGGAVWLVWNLPV